MQVSPTDKQTPGSDVPAWERIDTGPLSWVMSELKSSLERSVESLRTFSKNPEDITALRLARADLHQAHGALQLVDLQGVSLITEEVEHLLERFENAPQEADERAVEIVGAAFRAVTEYLEELLEGAPHQPVRLFPSYRSLLSLRGADRIHPADLFYPDLSIRPPKSSVQNARLTPEEILAQRTIFERALLTFLRDDKNPTAALEMQSAVAKIEGTPKQGQQRAFWWVTRAFFDALAAEALPSDLNVKRLAARMNLQIRRLLEGSGMVAERLLRDALFFVARADNATPHITEVKQVYGLNNSLPDDFETEKFSETNFAAVRAAKESLASAKAAWSLVVAGDTTQIAGFSKDASALLGSLGSVSRPGLAQVAQVVASIGTELSFDPRRPSESVGLDVATALLFMEGALDQLRSLDEQFDVRAQTVVARVESSALGAAPEGSDPTWLDEISKQAQERLTMASFVAEMQSNLRNIEKILDQFFRDPTQRNDLPQAEKLLSQIGGALSVLGHEQAGAAIRAGRASIQGFASPEYQPVQAEFERVAESLGAVGFYIESLQHRADSGAMFRFDEATGSFTADLKRPEPPLAPEPAEEPDPDPKTPGPGGLTPHSGPEGDHPEERSVEENAARHGDVAAELVRSFWQNPGDEETKAELVSALQQVKQDAMLLDDSSLKDKATQALKMLSDGVTAQGNKTLQATVTEVANQANKIAGHDGARLSAQPKEAPPPAPIPVAETAVDAELLEIFLMEAEEVLGNSREAVAAMRSQATNRDAMTDARRAYHTLKGSGRMVGLNLFGEAAWAVEQTLNLWLSENRPGSGTILELLDYTNRELGAWVSELTQTGSSHRQPADIVAVSEAVRNGQAFAEPKTAGASEVPGIEVHEITAEEPKATQSEGAASTAPSFASDTLVDQSPLPVEVGSSSFMATEIVSDLDDVPGELEFEPHRSHVPELPSVQTVDEHQWMATEIMPEAADEGTGASTTQQSDVAAFDEPNLIETVATTAQHPPAVHESLEEIPFEAAAVSSHEHATQTEAAEINAPAHAVSPPVEAADVSGDMAFAATEVFGEAIEEIEMTAPSDLAVGDVFAKEELPKVSEAPPVPTQEVLDEDLINTYVTGGDVDYQFEVPPAPAPVPTKSATVLPFAPVAGRHDEYKQIGSLTISVPLYNIYLTEADELLRVLTNDFGEWRHELNRNVSEAAVRAAHSLAGTSATVGLHVVHDLGFAVESVLQTLHRKPVPIELAEILVLEEGVESLRAMLHRFAAEILPEPDIDTATRLFDLRDLLRARHDPSQHPTAPPIDSMTRTNWIDSEEEQGAGAAQAPVEPADLAVPEYVVGEPEADVSAMRAANLAHADEPLELAPAGEIEPAVPADAPVANSDAHSDAHSETKHETAATLEDGSDWSEFVQGQAPHDEVARSEPVPADVSSSPLEEHTLESPVHSEDTQPAIDAPVVGEPAAAPATMEEVAAVVAESRSEPAAAARPSSAAGTRAAERVRDEIDPELIEIFLQEASEYMPQISANLREWQSEPAKLVLAQSLMRQLHTVKGSARMAGAMRLGEVVHEMETRVESGATLREIPSSLFEELLSMHDRATELYDGLMGRTEPSAKEQSDTAHTDGAESDHDALEAASAPDPVAQQPRAAAAVAPGNTFAAARPAANTQPVVQAVRVRADVLDRLVNQAGEVSISRSRLENEVTQIKTSLTDLTENLSRLRTQLREIEIQAETQMQSQLSLVKERERFDPLEFDRFTRLQELTRMMAESVSDVGTVQQNLVRSLDGASRDLSAQQRMTRDLQQDLMRVRMVPFSSVSECLYRVVRQSAKEMDKRVNLDIRGGGVEIDRSVLERMAAPFEHLLRNAVVHGVETRAERMATGKDETGELLVEVRQEGNEIVLVFSDDGAGLNVSRIREKARAIGMISTDEELGDARVADLIFQPGFTTVSEVTELAGRGFGMDVVRAEAGGLGGRVSVDSTPGAGTRFTINLPLTLAVTQVVLVTVAGRTYALPSVLVEQVQQLRPQPLAQAYNDGHILWLNQPVKLYFLAGLLGETDRSPIAQRYSPLLILRSGGERVAIHVDEVVGNQEVVVKNIGPQLARMSGVAGATVLGSGDIVLILNPVQLAQQNERERLQQAAVEPVIGGAVAELIMQTPVPTRAEPVAGLETLPTVMVVDDSLTVRRVTQRLLTREGYQVVLAKDGVDALQQLQDYTPDAMLVDIEMPRMDGFDLTRNVRGDERYHGIPIIMITSRTADKHREFAMELGVNVYLGKPYQEEELLGHLAQFTGAKRRAVNA